MTIAQQALPPTSGATPGNGPHSIELVTGTYLDLANPQIGAISLNAIAHALSCTARFTGQARLFYSVAEHTCLVAAKLESEGAPARVVFAGLHHDDTKAFLGDVTRPLKSIVPGYVELEARLTLVIARALELPLLNEEQQAQVKAADDWALSYEAYYLLPSRGRGWFCEGLYDPTVSYDLRHIYDGIGLPPGYARALWMRWHNQLVDKCLQT